MKKFIGPIASWMLTAFSLFAFGYGIFAVFPTLELSSEKHTFETFMAMSITIAIISFAFGCTLWYGPKGPSPDSKMTNASLVGLVGCAIIFGALLLSL